MEQSEREEIARLISNGFDAGRIDSENGRRVDWVLNTEEWTDREVIQCSV